jgi:hypothetical protein
VASAVAKPLWTSLPKPFECGPGGKIAPDNRCLEQTGFKPNTGTGDLTPWWGQYKNPKGNCTAYVAFRLIRNQAPYFLVPGDSNAIRWKQHAIDAGKKPDDRPAPGSVAWWDDKGRNAKSRFGHVAYVESVKGKTVYLSESHWHEPSKGLYGGSRRFTVTKGDRARWPDKFLHIKDKPADKPADKQHPLRKHVGKIVQSSSDRKAQKTAWLLDSKLRLRWIPTSAIYHCLQAKGVAGPVPVPKAKLRKLKKGPNVKCKPKTPPKSEPAPSEPKTEPVVPDPGAGPRPVSGPAVPKGHVDIVSSPAIGKVRTRGWSFDPNAPTDAVKVHVYVGGKLHKGVTANLKRNDVANAYAGAENPGPNHGFDITFSTSLKGSQQVCAYAINIGSGGNPKLGCKTVTVKASTPPKPSVTISKGGSAQGMPGCKSVYCRYIVVTFKNFSSGSHSIKCRASHGSENGYYTYTRSGTSNTSAYCYYGFPGHTVWVTVDGTSSNKIGW